MRLRRCIAVSLLFIAPSTRQASAQTTSAPPTQQAASQPAATHRINTNGISRFELQRMLGDLDDRRRRLRLSIDPADSVLRLLAADTLRLLTANRPPSVEDDSARVHDLFVQSRQLAASREVRAQLVAAVDATVNDFTSIETNLTSRITKPHIAREYLERSPFAAVVPVMQARPLENTRLYQSLHVGGGGPVERLPRSYLTEFETALSDSAFQSYRSDLLSAFSARATDIGILTKADRAEMARIQEDAAEITRAIGQREDDQARLDSRIVTIAIPVVVLALIGIFLAPLLYKSEDMRSSIITSGMLVELMTVFLLTTAVIILGVAGRIQAELIGTLLGGVSGYVLGRAIHPPARV
jgi:hypothetical protein